MYVCVYVCVYVSMCVYVCVYMYTHTHTHTHRDDAIDLSGAQKRGQCEFLRTHFLGTDRDVFERSGTSKIAHSRICASPCSRMEG